ncbi:MAG: divalent-cation tolerance protein CutA [Pseudomonadota bacterium]|nr:MAG: divalent-cation tolerance protein CutA [Pseudomonadota bacterium]
MKTRPRRRSVPGTRRFQLVLSTCPDADVAKRIAHTVVAEGLAACVNIVSVAQSIYRWQGKIESASEQLLLMKAQARDFRALEQRIKALHPYELPEIIAVGIDNGSKGYLAWLANPDKPS